MRQTGRLPEVVTKYGGWGDRQILICGGPAMVRATKAALIAKGAPPEHIQHDPLCRASLEVGPVHIVTLTRPVVIGDRTVRARAGMIGTSLSDDGVELLGQRRGLHAYLTAGKTMGIPILYPWANRLSANSYNVDGETVTLTPGDRRGPHRPQRAADPRRARRLSGLAGQRPRSANELTAELDFGADPRLLASFPFPHVLDGDVTLADRALTVRTTVTATDDTAGAAVLRLPPVPAAPRRAARASGRSRRPPLRHLPLDRTRDCRPARPPHSRAASETLGDKTSTTATTR